MKLGIYLDSEGNHGGVHQYSLALLNALMSFPKEKYSVIAICATQEWYDFCKNKDIECYYTEVIVSKENAFQFAKTLLKAWIKRLDVLEVRQRKIDYVIFPTVTPNMILIKNSICAIHDLMHRYEHRYPEISSIYQYVLRDILFKIIARKSVLVLVDSELGKQQVQDCYLHRIDDERIVPLPYIAPDYIYEASEDASESEMAEWDTISSKIPAQYFFYPAQFWRHKNHIALLRGIEIAKQANPDIHIVFVGSQKNAYKDVTDYIEEHSLSDNVTILGYVTNYSMMQLYKNAQALFMASCCGPTNIPQLEAFYLGCPVVVADVYAVKEQVKDAALLFAPDDYERIADYMKDLWTNNALRMELRQKGFQHAAEWGPKQFGERLFSIIETIRRN